MLRLTRILTLLVAIAMLVPAAASAARRADRNHDGLPDRWERVHHLSLKVDQGPRDQDHDGLNNRAEYADHTDPRDADSDNDGVSDANEDTNNDGVPNVAETPPAATPPPATPGEHHEGTLVPFDHVVSFNQSGNALEIARADGSTVTALVGEHTFLACGAAAPGPFQVCAKSNLTPGAKVIVARDEVNAGGVHVWATVLLGVTAPAGEPGPVPAPAPETPPAPAPVAAPAVTASVVSFTEGVLRIHRSGNGEEPFAPLSGIAEIRCITVAGGFVTSNESCSQGHLVAGAQLSLAQGGLADGVFKWMKLYLVVSGG